jgi:hypothetical protein
LRAKLERLERAMHERERPGTDPQKAA